jgi:4-amino-4-deoxy-L-arabinose transferase-like glycosyltransferase
VAVIYLVGRAVFGEATGRLTALWLAVYPPSLGYVLDIQAQAIESFLVSAIVFAFIGWRRHRTWWAAAILGVLIGAGMLSRPNLILVLPLLLAWFVFELRGRGLVHCGAAVLALILIIGPWVIRNSIVHGQFVLISLNGGFIPSAGANCGFCERLANHLV